MLFLFKLIILALFQGVGEILPISSSGHLIILERLFNIDSNDLTIEILLHLASLLALTFYYFDFIKNMVRKVYLYLFKKKKEYYLEWNYFTTLLIASIPTCLIGLILNNYLDKLVSYISILLIFNGVLLLVTKYKDNSKNIEDLTIKDKLKLGVIQSLGLVPGISRSGTCLMGCNFIKLNKEDSFNLTFLLLFPLVIGSVILNLGDFVIDANLIVPYIIIFLITFMTTYISMTLLHSLVSKGKSKIFGVYCVSIGVIYSIILLVI